jgi:hypothetical protein
MGRDLTRLGSGAIVAGWEVLSIGTMDLHDAIEDHVTLHQQVADYARKPDGALKAEGVQRPDSCDLGKWLPAEGAAHRALAQHATLTEAHTAFHEVCADTVRRADAGTLPESALTEKGELYASFTHLCFSISKLNVRIQ